MRGDTFIFNTTPVSKGDDDDSLPDVITITIDDSGLDVAKGDDDRGHTPPDIIIWDIDGDGEGFYQPTLPDMDWFG